MVQIIIDYEKCEGAECAECVEVCPMEILIIDGDKIKTQNIEECDLCETCVDVCPNEAIVVEED